MSKNCMMKFVSFNKMLTITVSLVFLTSCGSNESSKKTPKNISKQLKVTQLSVDQTGIDFKNTLIETPQINVFTYKSFHSGAGVCIGDINNDKFYSSNKRRSFRRKSSNI